VAIEAIDQLARTLRAAGEAGRRIAVFGATRDVATTLAAVTLARALAKEARVVLMNLAAGAPNLSAISLHPDAPGLTDVIRGSASFGEVITRDKLSRVHFVGAGRADSDASAILASQRFAIIVDALARTYDHVIIDVGPILESGLDRAARLAPSGVLVASHHDRPATGAARERLAAAGYGNVAVLAGASPAASAVQPEAA
jgi:Mrp family chromosome partitioning ATPase